MALEPGIPRPVDQTMRSSLRIHPNAGPPGPSPWATANISFAICKLTLSFCLAYSEPVLMPVCALAVWVTGPQTFYSLTKTNGLLEPGSCLCVATLTLKPIHACCPCHTLTRVSLPWPCICASLFLTFAREGCIDHISQFVCNVAISPA